MYIINTMPWTYSQFLARRTLDTAYWRTVYVVAARSSNRSVLEGPASNSGHLCKCNWNTHRVIHPCRASLWVLPVPRLIYSWLQPWHLLHGCIDREWLKCRRPTFPAALVAKAVKALAWYAIWHLDIFLEQKRTWIVPMLLSSLKQKQLKISWSSCMKDELYTAILQPAHIRSCILLTEIIKWTFKTPQMLHIDSNVYFHTVLANVCSSIVPKRYHCTHLYGRRASTLHMVLVHL